ncbi:MAG: divalent-cation tolerance protein CutA [Brachymonas sp.]|nr:divalent-cation tolerance protein CutA [Brachymonas sp.]
MPETKQSTELLLLVTTVDDEVQARNMARSVVEQGLAACVQIARIDSVYRWEGVVQEAAEWQLSCKVAPAHAQILWQALLAMHPYEVPMLYALPVAQVHQAYAQWVAMSGAGEATSGPVR